MARYASMNRRMARPLALDLLAIVSLMAAILVGWALPIVAAPGRATAPADRLPALDSVLRGFRESLRANAELFGQYTMQQKVTRRERDDDGRVTRTTTQIYEVRPNAWGAPAAWVLLSHNGKAVPARSIEKARQEANADRPTSEREWARYRMRANRERREMEEAIDDVFRVTEATLVGRAVIEGHPTLEIAFAPRPGAHPASALGRVLAKSAGRIWINEADRQLVRFEGEAIETILYGWGLVARIHKGTRLAFTRRWVDGTAWLPARYSLTGSARMLLVRQRRFDSTSEFFGYERRVASAGRGAR